MKKINLKIILSILLTLFLIIIVGIWVLPQKIGDVRPALLPAIKKEAILNSPTESGAPLTVPPGFVINYFSDSTPGARDLQLSPGGIMLVSMPGEGKIVALPDHDKNGVADEVRIIAQFLRKPHGLAFFQDKLFVAEENQVSRYLWDENNQSATFEKKLFDLPSGGRHTSRTIAISKSGQLLVSLGSSCDTCFEKHPFIAAVIASDVEGTRPRVYAKGLRNAVFIKFDDKGSLWGTEMGRDFLGDNLPPDEINIIEDGGDYGWPVCYGDQDYDAKFGQRDSNYCSNTKSPIFKLPAHVAPLGLNFFEGDLLVALHGSWNSTVPVGYKVVRLKLKDLSNIQMEDFITGFTVEGSKNVIGRPVDLEFGLDGSLYISDDKAGAVYRMTPI